MGRACETKDGYGYTDQSVIKFTEICGRYGEVCCRLHTLFRRVCTNRSQARNETKVASSYNLSTVSLNTSITLSNSMCNEIMDDEDIFLFCSNMSLGQYRAVTLGRGLTGGAGCLISLTILVIVLLVAKKKAWENLYKRIYFALIPYTFLYSTASIAAVNYNRPPSGESKWCEVRGFFLHHFGTLVFVHFCVRAIAVLLHITISLKLAPCKAIKDKLSPICCGKTEALLFLILFLLPLPDTSAPFSPQLPSYGNFGPLCWFRLELTENCTVSTFDISFIHMVPFAIRHVFWVLCVDNHNITNYSMWLVFEVSQ